MVTVGVSDLETSRLPIGERIELECAPTDLVALVRDAVGVHQETTDRHNLLIECSEDEVLGLWDMRRLGRVVDSLLSNAITYSPYGGTILVTLGTLSVRGGRGQGTRVQLERRAQPGCAVVEAVR